ncbi:MAG: hypothetical protein L0099_09820 [Acidobacteria bacterium]|nr:hypothetical protein [Acidobacteriota bacterium]
MDERTRLTPSPYPPRGLSWLLLTLAVALGLLRTLADRDLQGGDSISYLDIAYAWARGDFGDAVNSFWSPLYSWLLAIMLILLHPQPYWEFAAVSAVGFGVYLLAMACFLFFWRAIAAWRTSADADSIGFSPAAWLVLGYALFLWTTLHLARLPGRDPPGSRPAHPNACCSAQVMQDRAGKRTAHSAAAITRA